MIRQSLLFVFSLFICFQALPAQVSAETSANINQLDEMGRKTGHWVITGAMIKSNHYKPDQKVEEGEYVANKREGLWKRYHTNGKVKTEITYRNNRPEGPYKMFYPTGVVEEDGQWVNEHNVGSFKRFHPNGQVAQEFSFEDNGLRTGLQRYYYENGNPELEVEVVQGLEEGLMRRFYPNGDLMEEKMLKGGVVDKSTIKKYEPRKETQLVAERTPAVEAKASVRITEDKPNLEVFKHNGQNVLYNKQKQVTQIGEFKDGRLWNGKWKKYSANGLIEKIEIYKEGVYVGNAPITQDDM